MATDLLWRSLDVKIGLNASEETEDAASQETCDKADKTAAKKNPKKKHSGDDEEEDAMHTGPEPIYFGF